MQKPLWCEFCGHPLNPGDITRIGVFWVCWPCFNAAPEDVCSEGQHDYAGAVDDQQGTLAAPSTVWCCRRCGAVLRHQGSSTEVAEVPKESGYVDC